MNFFDSDDENEDVEKYGFYESSPSNNMPVYEQYFLKFLDFLNQYQQKLNEFDSKQIIPSFYHSENAIHPYFDNDERCVGILDIVPTLGDKIVTKLASAICYIDNEVSKIVEMFESSLFDALVIYGETSKEFEMVAGKNRHEGEYELQISRIVGVLKEIYELIKKLVILLHNLINQLHWINNKLDPLYKHFFKENPFNCALETLGKGISLILKLDALVKENEDLTNHWNLYKKMLKIIKSDPQKFNTSEAQIKAFEKVLFKIDKTVLSGNCLNICFSQNFDIENINTIMSFSSPTKERKSFLIKDNKEYYSMFINYIKESLKELNEIIGTSTETIERKKFLNILGVYSLCRKLFPKEEDRKLWKLIWSFQKRVPLIFVHSHVNFILGDFLLEVTPLSKKSKKKSPKDHLDNLKKFLIALDAGFEHEIHGIYLHFCAWISKMESSLLSNHIFKSRKPEDFELVLQYRSKLLMSGILLSNQIRNKILDFMQLHLHQKVEINKSMIKSICLGVQMLKAIEYLTNKNFEKFHTSLIARLISKDIFELIKPHFEKAKKAKKSKEKEEIYISLQLFINSLSGYNCPLRISVLNFATNLLSSVLKDSEMVDLKYLIWKLEIILYYKQVIKEATNCDFLYWSPEVIYAFFKYFYENPKENDKIAFVLSSLNDCACLIKKSKHLETNDSLFESFKKDLLDQFKNDYLNLIARDVEDYLRITIHSILIDKIKGPNPFKIDMKNLKKLLENDDIRILDVSINIKNHIENKLNESFYNLNILNLYDYETYEELRQLASEQFGISLLNVYIPSQTLEQGALDIINIIRNIQSFVLKFNYNMYNQTFIELTKDGRMLSTVGIQQIADSIKTHGLGIINSNINSVYKFVLKKFNVFSQFLFDELIQSPLIREFRYFNENKIKLNNYYPYERAELLYKEIKKLGVFEDGNNFMDKFRLLITSIGNALGFVRLIKSASLNYCSKLIEYMPLYNEDLDLTKILNLANLGESSKNATSDLEDIIFTYKEQFSTQTDYLNLLIKAFENVVKSDNQKHLSLYYFIIPPLLMNYIEHILINKEKLLKKNSQDGFLTDDGFPIGCAYFLKLLKMEKLYDGLHWEEVVRNKFNSEIKENTKDPKDGRDKKSHSVTKRQVEEINMQKDLSLRKVTMQKEEYELLFYAFKNSRILFSN